MKMDLTKATDYLSNAQNADGGWGYYLGRDSSPEPTIHATLALGTGNNGVDGKARRAARRGLNWLASRRKPNGALALPNHREDHWTTLLYLSALVKLKEPASTLAEVTKWITKFRSSPLVEVHEVDLDGTLIGWSWVPSTFGWVEPTSYGLIALKQAGLSEHQRVHEATRLLLDRVCDDGGWNYGNREVLGQRLTSYLPTTALATMALQHEPAAEPIINKSLNYLAKAIALNSSALNLALTLLCFHAFSANSQSSDQTTLNDLRAQLFARQREAGDWVANAHLTALAMLALTATSASDPETRGAANVFLI